MTDMEAHVVDRVMQDVLDVNPDAFITTERVAAPPSFPCVRVSEENNSTYTPTLDQEMRENHSLVMYQIEVFSNRKDGRKQEAKTLRNVVDAAMISMGFIRMMSNEMPNVDPSIYRIVSRYQCLVSPDLVVFRA